MTTQEFIQMLVNQGVITPEKATAALSNPAIFSENLYGTQNRNTVLEQRTASELGQQELAAGVTGQISSNFIKSSITNDPSIVGFYINALAYGGYTMKDILQDIKQRELYSTNPSFKKVTIISPTVISSIYKTSPEGKAATTYAASKLPVKVNATFDQKTLDYGTNIPDELYQSFDTIQGRDTEAFRDAVANMKSAFYDMQTAQLQATTEQQKAVADADYKEFKRQVEVKYGIILSDNADKAWKQIEDLENSYNTRGIAGSGMQNEAIDDYLRVSRRDDQRNRDVRLTTEEEAKAKQMKATGTAAEIAALTPEERQKYGLAPSAEVLALYDMNALRKKFPNMPEEELQNYRDAMIDENGNYRSTLYSKYYNDIIASNAARKLWAEGEVTAKDKDIKDRQNELDNPELGVFNTAGPGHINDDLYPTDAGSGSGAGAGNGTSNVNVSSSQSDIINLQNELVAGGYMKQAQMDTGPGTYGPKTTAAVAARNAALAAANPTPVNPNGIRQYSTQTSYPQAYDEKGQPIYANVANPAPTSYQAKHDPTINTTQTPGTISSGSSTRTSYARPAAPVIKPPVITPNVPTSPTSTARTGYQGGSIVDYLNSIGKDSSLTGRKALGATSGIDYSTTNDAYATQNAALLKKLRGY